MKRVATEDADLAMVLSIAQDRSETVGKIIVELQEALKKLPEDKEAFKEGIQNWFESSQKAILERKDFLLKEVEELFSSAESCEKNVETLSKYEADLKAALKEAEDGSTVPEEEGTADKVKEQLQSILNQDIPEVLIPVFESRVDPSPLLQHVEEVTLQLSFLPPKAGAEPEPEAVAESQEAEPGLSSAGAAGRDVTGQLCELVARSEIDVAAVLHAVLVATVGKDGLESALANRGHLPASAHSDNAPVATQKAPTDSKKVPTSSRPPTTTTTPTIQSQNGTKAKSTAPSRLTTPYVPKRQRTGYGQSSSGGHPFINAPALLGLNPQLMAPPPGRMLPNYTVPGLLGNAPNLSGQYGVPGLGLARPVTNPFFQQQMGGANRLNAGQPSFNRRGFK
mmetsp:Transcript_15636/g.26986  ORF Transcript_15636/g.26986 Transcript_15636/m.26986 type:complete len:395 (+) Transcript_15636:62-1246(+)